MEKVRRNLAFGLCDTDSWHLFVEDVSFWPSVVQGSIWVHLWFLLSPPRSCREWNLLAVLADARIDPCVVAGWTWRWGDNWIHASVVTHVRRPCASTYQRKARSYHATCRHPGRAIHFLAADCSWLVVDASCPLRFTRAWRANRLSLATTAHSTCLCSWPRFAINSCGIGIWILSGVKLVDWWARSGELSVRVFLDSVVST